MKNNIPMRNIFSKTTAEKRTPNGVKTESKRTNYGYTILLFAFLTLGFGQAWADDPNTGHTINSPHFYYYNSADWANCMVLYGRGWDNANWTDGYNLDPVTGTKLYYAKIAVNWNNTYNQIAVLNAEKSGNNWKGEGNAIESRWSYATDHTDNVVWNYDLVSPKIFLWDGKSASSITWISDSESDYTKLNHSQTVEKWTSTDNGSTYSKSSTNSGTITISAYKMTGNGTASNTSNSATINTISTTSASKDAAYTGEVTLTASANAGFTFVGWYDDSNTFISNTNPYTYNAPNSTKTIRARFKNETVHQVTVSYTCTSPSTTVKATETPYVGEVTASTFTAGTPVGFTFTSWTVGDGLTITSGSTSSNSISVTTKSSGSYTLTANYTEDLTTPWYIAGDAGTGLPFTGWGTSGTRMYKKSGHSTEEIYYCTITPTTTAVGTGFAFQAYNSGNTTYYGFNDRQFKIDQNSCTLYSGNPNNMRFLPYIIGDYEFELDNTGSDPVLTIHWPVINQVRISAASPADATNVGNFNLSDPVSNVRTVTRTLAANTTYTFKIVYDSEWYGKTSGALTRSTSTSSNTLTDLSTSGGDMTLTTDYAGSYTFKFNQSTKNLSVDFPEAYQITWGVGNVAGNKYAITCKKYGTNDAVISNSTWILKDNRVTFYAGNNEPENVVQTGYTWRGYYGDANGSTSQLSNQTGYSPTISTAGMSFYACFYENNYFITPYIVGQGTVDPAVGQNGHVATKVSFTATPGTGYKFDNWTQRSGTLTIESPNNVTTNVNATAASELQANFSPKYAVRVKTGGGAWSAESANHLTGYGAGQIGYVDITLNANTDYEIQVYDRETNTWYGGSATQNIYYANSNTEFTIATTSSPQSVFIKTGAAGTYRFAWNLTGYKIAVEYPTSRFIEIGQNIAEAGSVTAVDGESNTIVNGQAIRDGGSITFTAATNTGYNFSGWFDNEGCTTGKYTAGTNVEIDGNAMTLSSINADKTVYAKFVPKTYTVTLTQTGAKTEGSTSATATYNAVLPGITLPTPNDGYAFMGYYSAADGEGRQFINPSGEWVANAGDTISDSKWIRDGDVTLYAYYKKAEITEITFSPGTVVENNSTVTVTATISPAPTGTTSVCWRVLYDNDSPLDPQPEFDPATAKGNSVSFTASNASGMYKVEAKLHTGNSCGGGTLLSTRVESFQVAGSHTVTIAYKQGSTPIKASASITARPLEWSEAINAPDIFGYTFDHWTAGDGITLSTDGSTPVGSDESSANPIYIKANYNGTLTANYTQKNIVYFKDNLGWTDPDDADAHIYVNLLTEDYWNASNGSGNKGKSNCNLAMDRVPGTADIFYYDYGSKPTSHFISFTKEDMNNYESFYQGSAAHVVFPSRALDALSTNNDNGLGFYAATPMFVPLATQTPVDMNSGHAKYYNDGYWTKYLPGTGYTLQIYNESGSSLLKTIAFTSADELMPMKAVADLEGGHTYKFQLKRDGDVYYGNGGTMTYTDHGQNTAWDFYNNSPFKMCTIKTNAAGDYTFNLSYSPNSSGTIKNRLRIAVDYPVASGDYRLVYTDDTRSGRIKPSAIVPKENDGTAIVSFFVRKDQSPVLRIQQATVALDGTITWKEYPIDGAPTNQITGSIASAITATGVWNFNLEMNGSGAMSVASTEAYKGNYYIRTDAANSKWDNYRTDPNHVLTSSDYLKSDVGYTHYYTHWVNKDDVGRKNVKFVIANDYSPCISDTLARETATGTWANIDTWMEEGGDLKRSANVRFMWDEETNKVARAYIDGAQGAGSDNFLKMLSSDGMIKNADGSDLSDGAVYFTDNQNWIYEANVKAQPNAQIKLISNWGTGGSTITQYFKGTADATEALIGGSGSTWYNIRLLYDFKTNRLVAAYIPSGEITNATAINADVMFIREHQGDIAQLTFSGAGTITNIKTAYGVLRFNKWTLNNKEKTGSHNPLDPELSIYERSLYWISFPFRVKLSEVFGFGTYMNHWAIQRYDGAGRAAIGHFLENGSFWRWMDRSTEYLEPNQGYLLSIDVDLLGESSDVWGPESLSEQIELYFPSYGEMPNLTSDDVEQTLPAHTCTINRAATEGLPDTGNPATSYNRTIFDSHWNVMGVPTYVNTDDVTFANTTWTSPNPKFLYTWNSADNTISATTASGFNYQAMHSYMVQYYDKVTWSAKSGSPYAIVARKTYAEKPREIELRLELQQNEQMIDPTYVVLSNDEDVSANFAFGEDMCKEFNAHKASIFNYTADHVGVAGNTMPMSNQTTIIPIGLNIKSAGDYTFAIPEGTEGIGVTLVDNETGIRTSLSALSYTVNLQPGDYTGRFVLEISPIAQTPTGVETVTGEGLPVTGVRKVMIDGILYIVKDGKMYDARGARVQ